MEEQLISFKTAKLAKNKGYKQFARNGINLKGETIEAKSTKLNFYNPKYTEYIACPTQALLQRWLREEHDFHIEISINTGVENGWAFSGTNLKKEKHSMMVEFQNEWERLCFDGEVEWESYEQVLETALYQALKVMK